MRISDSLTEKLLKNSGEISKEDLAKLLTQHKEHKLPLQDLAVEQGLISEADLTQLYAKHIGLPFIALDPKDIKTRHLKLLPEHTARRYAAIVFSVDSDGNKLVAMEDPENMEAAQYLKKLLGSSVKINLATSSDLRAALERYRPQRINFVASSSANSAELSDSAILKQTLNLIIERALALGASDVHIEPRDDHLVVRYRIDGLLSEQNKLPVSVHDLLINQLKSLAALKASSNTPQEGDFQMESLGQSHVFRVSTLPTMNGEKIVMRLLRKSGRAPSLAQLGLWGKALKDVQHTLVQPHGLILVCGPVGAGKSTTLYSILSLLSSPRLNISTVEDPIEYLIPGSNQVQVSRSLGIDFKTGLEAVLRQDPNVIMVGETNDSATAHLVVHTASHGRLMLSTLYTPRAGHAVQRLVDMEAEPFIVASTLRLAVAQTLVRRVCVNCHEAIKPDTQTVKRLEKLFSLNKKGGYKELHALEEQAISEGMGVASGEDKPNSTSKSITRLYRASSKGCEKCNFSGYKGRVGIFEVLPVSSSLQKQITASAESSSVEKVAVEEGMVSLELDGLVKALRGITTVNEIVRILTN